MRIGVYGGGFNPIHFGHLLLAETARVELCLDRFDFVPTGTSPYSKNLVSSDLRLQMLDAVLRSYPEFSICRFEIDNPGVSYTVKTLRHYRDNYPNDEIFLTLSSETLNDLPNWKSAGEICELASLIVARRVGYDEPNFDALKKFVSEKRVSEFRDQVIHMPYFGVSSSLIRARIAEGKSVRFLTPDPVIEFIQTHGLYKSLSTTSK